MEQMLQRSWLRMQADEHNLQPNLGLHESGGDGLKAVGVEAGPAIWDKGE